MKTRIIETMTEEDEKIVTNLRAIGMTRKASKVLTYMLQKGSGSALDIEITTGMRQPEVSIGLKELSTWMKTELNNRNGSKRPVTIYSMAVPVSDVITHYYRDACRNWDVVSSAYESLVDIDAKISIK